ncbi:MAG: spore maturation protein [Bacillota bacterium]|jgi:spore maturation protein B
MLSLLNVVSVWLVPAFVAVVLVAGWLRRVPVFDEFVEGAKEGLSLTAGLFPYLLAMLVAISVLRESGALGALTAALSPLLSHLNWPAETVPLALMRPFSGSGALAITADLLQRHGPDSFVGLVASTMQGSTDTTFFVLTVYFGSVGIKKIRHSLWAGLTADLAAMLSAVFLCALLMT